MVDNSLAHHLMTAAVMQIMIPVASPPRNAPTSAAIFEVSGSLASCGSGAVVGVGCSTGGSGIEVVGLGSSTCGSGVGVGLGCVSGVQEGLHTLTMFAV